MHHRIRWSVRAVGAALGLLGVAVFSAAPSQAAGSNVATSSVPAAADAETSRTSERAAAARYGWGTVIAGDEFDYTGSPDSAKWRVYDSAGHAGRGVRTPDAWQVDGGVATVTGDAQGRTGGMSARHGQKYGRWEARMKTSLRDPKYHPVLLLWPDVRTSNCPEVNFAESTTNPEVVNFFLHYGCEPRQVQEQKSLDMTQWHTYAVEWTPTRMVGYIDGVEYFRNTNPGHLPKVSMHASIQLDWMPDRSATRRTTMSVDWIRVYRPF
jgi:beta-glucanase (GH16 family)